MSERDFVYGGFYQNIPCNMPYANPNFYNLPGNFNPIENPENIINGDIFLNITNRINELENKVKQKLIQKGFSVGDINILLQKKTEE